MLQKNIFLTPRSKLKGILIKKQKMLIMITIILLKERKKYLLDGGQCIIYCADYETPAYQQVC